MSYAACHVVASESKAKQIFATCTWHQRSREVPLLIVVIVFTSHRVRVGTNTDWGCAGRGWLVVALSQPTPETVRTRSTQSPPMQCRYCVSIAGENSTTHLRGTKPDGNKCVLRKIIVATTGQGFVCDGPLYASSERALNFVPNQTDAAVNLRGSPWGHRTIRRLPLY